jgi:hypothetical protein
MDDDLEVLTLVRWITGVWDKHSRGIKLSGQEEAIVYCMAYHAEWSSRWDSLGTSNDPETFRDVLHVHYDATIKMQIDNSDPPEIRKHYERLRSKGYTEFEAIHTLIPAFSEASYTAKTKKEPFDNKTYLRLSAEHVKLALQRPILFRRQGK